MSNFGTTPPNTGFGFGSGGEGDSSTAASACTCMSVLTCTGFIKISYVPGTWWRKAKGEITGVDGGLSAGPDWPKDLDTLLYPSEVDLKVTQATYCMGDTYGTSPGGEISVPVTPPGEDPRSANDGAITYPPCFPSNPPGCKVKYRLNSSCRRGKNTSWLRIGYSQAKNMGSCLDCEETAKVISEKVKNFPIKFSGPATELLAMLEAKIEAALPHKGCE